MINRVVLVGRLTKDPELRKTNSGNAVCSFTVAVDNWSKNPDGTKSSSFIPCTIWMERADTFAQIARKGMLVGVEGRLNQRSFERKDGTKASVLEVICDNTQFLEPKAVSEQRNGNRVEEPTQDQAVESNNLETIDLTDDDLPPF